MAKIDFSLESSNVRKLTQSFALLACFAAISSMATVNAQSGSRTQTARPQTVKPRMVKPEMAKSEISRAFTNGYNVPSTGIAIEGYCPVCYLAANKAVKGTPEFAYDYDGVTYWFVNDAARQTFAANPKKYLPAYGGWCALGAAMGQRFPVDPTNFKIVDGRIMLFLKNKKVDGVAIWSKNEPSNLRKADTNWKKLKG